MNYPCDRFAAFLAHSLNSEDQGTLHLEPGGLYASLTDALASRYAESLLHHSAYAFRMSEEEAATRYFAASLERGLLLTGNAEISISHKLFSVMCRRGAEPGWAQAEFLRRIPEFQVKQGARIEYWPGAVVGPKAVPLSW
jgi:hypothetical protein